MFGVEHPDASGPHPSPQTKRSGPFCPPVRFVLCCSRIVGHRRLAGAPAGAPAWGGSPPPSSRLLLGPGTLLAGLPILSFLEHVLTNVPLLYKGLEKRYFNKLVLGGRGGRGREQVDHHVVDFNIGCKITNAYNKPDIYSVLRFNVQSEFECSFLICVVGESILCISG